MSRAGATRDARIAAFNQELEHRLAALDREETVDPAEVRQRLEQKSRERKRRNA